MFKSMVSKQNIFILIAVVFSAAMLDHASKKLAAINDAQSSTIKAPPLSYLPPPFLDTLLLGNKDLYDDFAHIWVLQSSMNKDLVNLSKDQYFNAVNLLAKRRPTIESFYLLSCFVLDEVFELAEKCIDINLEGLKAIPHSWRIPMTQGYMFNFRLGDHKKAAVFYSLASTRESSPPYVASLSKKLISKTPLSQEQIKALKSILMGVQNSDKVSKFIDRHQTTEGNP